jgi:hypothetical protein
MALDANYSTDNGSIFENVTSLSSYMMIRN